MEFRRLNSIKQIHIYHCNFVYVYIWIVVGLSTSLYYLPTVIILKNVIILNIVEIVRQKYNSK